MIKEKASEMEIELKYSIPDSTVADAIWDNELFKEFEETDSREERCLIAKYFDTDECDLAKNEIAYRVRKEDESFVAALKWKGYSEDGLHVREELNVPVTSYTPDPAVFRESPIGTQVMELIGDRSLNCIMETAVCRRSFRIDTGKALFEISIDSGRIETEYGREPIEEVEIELFSGEQDELLEIGRRLQKKFSLEEENGSKYSRGMEIIKKNR